MNKRITNVVISIIVVLAVLLLLPVVFIGTGFILSIAQETFRVLETSELTDADIKNISDSSYKIFFAKCGRGPKGDGTVQEIYSINSDGTDLKFEKNESSEKWAEEVQGYGVSESMGNFHGDFDSPDKTKEFVVKTGLFNTGWFAMFTKPELYVAKKDFQQKLLWGKGFVEAVWLLDSERVVVVSDKIYIIDSEIGNYASLVNEYGCMIKVEENNKEE